MLLNIFAEPVSKVLKEDLKKAIHYLENELEHIRPLPPSILADQAISFRSAYGIQNSSENRTMQLALIDEEFKEFTKLFTTNLTKLN